MAINKYVFVAVNEKFDGKFRIGYSITEIVDKLHEIKNTRVRAALEYFRIGTGLEVVSMADVPSSGSGLGASSSFSVGLMHALSEFTRHPIHADKHTLAEAACHLEMDLLGEQIGKQDQYAAAFGGLNIIDFSAATVTVKPVVVSKKRLVEFNSHIAVFYVGGVRSAANYSHILSNNFMTDENKFLAQQAMVAQVVPFKNALMKGDYRLLGEILHEGWMLKKKTSPLISNSVIDEAYRVGMKSGAWGGKLLGAGGGGFMLFIVPPRSRKRLFAALAHLRELPVGFDAEGSKVVFNRYKGES